MQRKLLAEVLGTFVLVFGGCGSAVFGGSHELMGLTGVALAFGLTVLTMAYAVGPISGGHFNPAVTLGLVAAGRHPAKQAPGYIAAQVVGAILAAAVIAVIAKANGAKALGQFAANGWGPEGMKNQLDFGGAFLTEAVTTMIFLIVIVGVTSRRAAPGFAPLAIGLCLTLIHLITIPLTNTSVNPARSTGQALLAGGIWLEQLWLFWVAPIVGGALGGLIGRYLDGAPDASRG